jgi:hypothetical protein
MFEAISRKFQLKFKDGADSDKIVVAEVKDRIAKGKLVQCIVLGILRGGPLNDRRQSINQLQFEEH